MVNDSSSSSTIQVQVTDTIIYKSAPAILENKTKNNLNEENNKSNEYKTGDIMKQLQEKRALHTKHTKTSIGTLDIHKRTKPIEEACKWLSTNNSIEAAIEWITQKSINRNCKTQVKESTHHNTVNKLIRNQENETKIEIKNMLQNSQSRSNHQKIPVIKIGHNIKINDKLPIKKPTKTEKNQKQALLTKWEEVKYDPYFMTEDKITEMTQNAKSEYMNSRDTGSPPDLKRNQMELESNSYIIKQEMSLKIKKIDKCIKQCENQELRHKNGNENCTERLQQRQMMPNHATTETRNKNETDKNCSKKNESTQEKIDQTRWKRKRGITKYHERNIEKGKVTIHHKQSADTTTTNRLKNTDNFTLSQINLNHCYLASENVAYNADTTWSKDTAHLILIQEPYIDNKLIKLVK